MLTRLAAVVGFVVAISGCRVVEPNPPPEAPRIGSFTASKSRVAAGEEVTLSFTAAGATKIEILDDAGNAVQAEGTASAGTAKVAPVRTSFYVLRVTGQGGRDTAFVQIAVNEPLKDLFLIAVPATIEAGQSAQLLWGAAGATSVTLTAGSGTPQTLTGTTGSVVVTPTATERYTLTAQGAPGTPPLTAVASVDVHPVLVTAAMTADDGVQPTKTLTFTWRTAGAERVTITEQTFGPLTSVTEPSSVVQGSFNWVLPEMLPGGIQVTDGLPLRFTVSVSAADVTVVKQITAVVGQKPVIENFVAPDNVSAGRTFTVSWKTLNATQVTITAGGLPLFRTLANAQARVDEGSVSLPAPTVQTEYKLVASNDRGQSTERVFSVRPVALPTITTYTLTGAFNALGDPVTARWTTANATRVQVRFEGGATLATVTTASQVASGSTVLTLANAARITLEASNSAGDVVSETRAVAFNGSPAAYITPTPALRGTPVTLDWSLMAGNVLEVVGLPTPASPPVPSSPLFVDLNTISSAQELFFADTANGASKLPTIAGFRFPLLGRVQNELWVSVNGFISFSRPSLGGTNTDISDAGDSTPSILAPLWDDLAFGAASHVLYALQTSNLGESYLVVQWDKVQLAGDPMSELTFEAHLYETGQVAFIYKTVSTAINSATIGVKDTAWPAAQLYAFNSTTVTPSADLELNFFTGGPANGSLGFNASSSRFIEFIGRTATGLVPARAELRSFGLGDVVVNEAMPFPEASASALGQWIEFKNNTAGPLNLEGLVVDTVGSSVDGGYTFPPGTVLDAGALLVIGQSLDTNDTGGAAVNLVGTDVPLGADDRVRVSLDGTPLDTLSWDAGTPGTSIMSKDPSLLVASGQTFTCPRSRTFGSNGALGTPGAANEPCAPYVLSSIPGGFRRAPAGSEMLATIDSDEGFGNFTLSAPFNFFGQQVSGGTLSSNGFFSLGPTFSSTSTICAFCSNDTVVSTSAPNGIVAVFWDDMDRDLGKTAMWRDGDRTILSWENVSLYASSSTESPMNFQVHLVDDGTIEFHYGNITSTSTTASTLTRLTGDSATIWLERQDGAIAVPHAINQANSVFPNSGLRFTPVP